MLKIQESTETLKTLLEMDIFADETKRRVMGADIILIPDVGKIEGIAKAFKPDTKTFYKFANNHNSSEKKIEVLENEGELTVLNFHSHEVWLPNLYIKDINSLPIAMDIVNNYVLEKQNRTNDEVIVNFSLKIETNGGACHLITFKGALNELIDSIKKVDVKSL